MGLGLVLWAVLGAAVGAVNALLLWRGIASLARVSRGQVTGRCWRLSYLRLLLLAALLAPALNQSVSSGLAVVGAFFVGRWLMIGWIASRQRGTDGEGVVGAPVSADVAGSQ